MKKISKKEQEKLLQEIMKNDQELGLYDMDVFEKNNKLKDEVKKNN